MNTNTVTIGADPEFFVVDNHGTIVPICGKLGGKKGDPVPMKGLSKGFAYQEDNVMAEFNIPPTIDSGDFASYVRRGVQFLTEALKAKGLMPVPGSAQTFADKLISPFPEALVFGCSPDYNAYEAGAPFPKIDPKELRNEKGHHLRFAGGHVHIGYDAPDVPPFVAAAFADIFLGLRLLAADRQGARRSMYGQPGRYRPTSFGIEYRTLSNAWIWDWDTAYHVGVQAKSLGLFLQQPLDTVHSVYSSIPWDDVRDIISRELSPPANAMTKWLYRRFPELL